MPARRRLLPVLATVALTLPAAPARAQGAGDDQYQDPFGSANTSQRRPSATARQTQTTPGEPGLSSKPPVTPSQPSSSAPAQPAPAPAPATALPRTGMEVPGTALLGLGLLMSGVGLRLRTADETLY